MLQRPLPAGFIAPCLPTKTDRLPSGSQRLHEIKHDGFRVIARKKDAQVRLYSRPGNDLMAAFAKAAGIVGLSTVRYAARVGPAGFLPNASTLLLRPRCDACRVTDCTGG
jgi:ATP-dependent DNA ligase